VWLADVRFGRAALHFSRLPLRDCAGFGQTVRQMSNAAHKLPVVGRSVRALIDQVLNGAAVRIDRVID
jgi:hypothetical protein